MGDRELAQAAKLNAEVSLDLISELAAGRLVMQDIAATLVGIREQNSEILDQLRNAHSRATESEGKIRLLEQTSRRHETRLSALEAAKRPA